MQTMILHYLYDQLWMIYNNFIFYKIQYVITKLISIIIKSHKIFVLFQALYFIFSDYYNYYRLYLYRHSIHIKLSKLSKFLISNFFELKIFF